LSTHEMTKQKILSAWVGLDILVNGFLEIGTHWSQFHLLCTCRRNDQV